MATYPATNNLNDLVETNPPINGSEDAAKITDALLETRRTFKAVLLASHNADGTIKASAISGLAGVGVADGSITGGPAGAGVKIAAATITADNLATGAVTSAKILDGTIVNADIADTTITGAKLALATVDTAQLKDGSVTSAKLAAGASAIADNSIVLGKLAVIAGGPKILVVDQTASPNGSITAVVPSGAVTMTAAGVFSLNATAAIVTLPVCQAIENRATGVDCGAFAANVYTKRALTLINDPLPIGLTIDASGFFSVPAGTYIILIQVPGYSCGLHKAHLVDVTAWNASTASQQVLGFDGTTASSPDGVVSHSFISGQFTFTGTKKFAIYHKCTGGKTTNGLGIAANLPSIAGVAPFSPEMFANGAVGGDSEYYTVVTLIKTA